MPTPSFPACLGAAVSRLLTASVLTGALLLALVTPAVSAAAEAAAAPSAGPVRWLLAGTAQVGTVTPTVLGAPQPLPTAEGPGLHFDGRADGLVLPMNPLAGLPRFTVEMLLRPDPDGPAEQRYFHAQDAAGHRALLELRMEASGAWSLDTFLYSGADRRAVIDRAKTHPAGRWTWVALVYDGKTLSGFVDGARQGQGTVAFPPMGDGETSLGVRLNRVAWYKGALREVRVHPRALAPDELARAGD